MKLETFVLFWYGYCADHGEECVKDRTIIVSAESIPEAIDTCKRDCKLAPLNGSPDVVRKLKAQAHMVGVLFDSNDT